MQGKRHLNEGFVDSYRQVNFTVVTFPCFTVVKSFIGWYALLLLFFLRFSSISLHCSPIQFSSAFFMHLLMLLFTSLYFSDTSGSNLFFLGSSHLWHRSRISAVTQVFCLFVFFCFLLTMFAKDLTGSSSHCCVEDGGHWISVCIFVAHNGERCQLPAYPRSLKTMPHRRATDSEPMDRILLWAVQQDQLRSISIQLSPDRHTGWPPHPSQRNWGFRTIIEEREVSWSRRHPSKTGSSRWRGCYHRSHDIPGHDLGEWPTHGPSS